MKKISLLFLLGCLFFSPLLSSDSSNLRFVVIADINPDLFSQKDFSVFEKEIEQINSLKPDLVINLGDLIYGHGLRRTRPQWERYLKVVEKIQAPYYQVPGNHDIFSSRSKRIYLEIFKETYTSFTFKNHHFVLLYNVEDNVWGKIGPEQLAWLKDDLENPDWDGAYVFVHVPVWDLKIKNVKPEWRKFWFDDVHPLLMRSKVKAVFAGHTHRFGPTRIYDGIHYYIAGGGGPKLHSEYIKKGGQNFFLLVEVSVNGTQVKVVMDNKVLSEIEADILRDEFGPYYYRPGNSTN